MTVRLRPALGLGALAVALALTASPVAAAPPRAEVWVPVELGSLGGERTVPTAVNDAGQVVGRSQVADGRWHAFVWADGEMTDLTPDAQDANATDVSDAGHVSGWVQPAPGQVYDAVVWRDGEATVLAHDAFAGAVNERGQVAGNVMTAETWTDAPFVWAAGRRTDLGQAPFPDARTSASFVDLNDRGQVLALGEYDDDSDLAYVWTRGRFTELRAGGDVVRGVDLDERGRVAGSVGLGGGLREAALWRDGRIVRLGVLPGTRSSQALALNDAGVVVGVSEAAPGGARPQGTGFVWQRGVLQAVTTQGWSVATEVDERGLVAGQMGATASDGTEVAQPFVWQRGALVPLGEPSSDDVTVVDLSEEGHVLTVTGDLLAERGVLWVRGEAPRS